MFNVETWVVSESKCGTLGMACLRASSRTCGALGASDNWSNRRWGLVSLVQEIESLTPKVVGLRLNCL